MITIPSLTGRQVRLDPLSQEHAGPLLAAAAADRSTYGLTRVPSSVEEMRAYVDQALADHAAGTVVPFAVVVADSGPGFSTSKSGPNWVAPNRPLSKSATPGWLRPCSAPRSTPR